MKKLFVFIRALLAKLSRADKEIIQLRDYIKIIDEEIQNDNKLIMQWYDAYIRVKEERDKYWKWFRKAGEDRWHSEMQRLALINMFHDQLEEKWQEAMNDKWCGYVGEGFWWFEDFEDTSERDDEMWAEEIQQQKDWEYLRWVEDELGIEYEQTPEDWHENPCEHCFGYDCYDCTL